jgi:hypothetical protein
MPVAPGDERADHVVRLEVVPVVGPVESKVPEGSELALDYPGLLTYPWVDL